MRDLEHPDITHALLTGYPKDVSWPRCPVCGEECETLYRSGREVIGCDHCVEKVDAWEYEQDFR